MLSIKMEGQMRSFPDKRRLREYISTKPAVQEMPKGLLYEDEGKRGTQVQREKRAINKYLSIITLNLKWIKWCNEKT